MPQEFYFPEGHPGAGVFKGMAIILEECGYQNTHSLGVECPKFQCLPDATSCWCCCILFNELYSVNVKSILEEHCAWRGYQVIFLPKFHCKLNFLEMVWGRAKRAYHLFLSSSKEEDLEANMIKALDSVTIDKMRKWVLYYKTFIQHLSFNNSVLSILSTGLHVDLEDSWMHITEV